MLTFKENVTKAFIFTDSTADLLPSDANRMGITVLPVSIVFGSDVYRDGIDIVASGHIHNVGHHSTIVNGKKRTLFVLGGWEGAGCHLDIENGKFHLRKWKDAS